MNTQTTPSTQPLINGYTTKYLRKIDNFFLEESLTQEDFLTLNY